MDYESLKLVWWVLIGVLLIGWAVTDGFDMGVLSLLKIVGQTDNERRVMLNTVGPHWDGNQVWFITAAGAIFAAWPVVYATAFSGLYFALLLVLFAMFFRPVGFEYRSKIEEVKWRSNWDWLLTIGGAVPSLVFGIAFGNLFVNELTDRFSDTTLVTFGDLPVNVTEQGATIMAYFVFIPIALLGIQSELEIKTSTHLLGLARAIASIWLNV
mgnify:CR=1 FL=1